MMKSLRTTAMTVLFAGVASAAFAQGSTYKDVVRDERGNTVNDARGNCVFTMWDANSDQCANRPAPAPTPMPYTQPQNYLVFFDFDRAEITAESRNILETVANDYARNGHVPVVITGHADRSGTDAYNLRLSQRRAQNVKSALAGMGVRAGDISVQARGESDPLVPTDDGVREPQNRRVEILFSSRP